MHESIHPGSVMFEADTSDMAHSTSSVTFAKHGDVPVLKSFGTAGGQGFFIPQSLPEKEAKKTGAKSTKGPSQIWPAEGGCCARGGVVTAKG
jgi:hypothetical protein